MWGITFVSISSELNLTRIYSELNLKHIDACDILYHVVYRGLKFTKDFHEQKRGGVIRLKQVIIALEKGKHSHMLVKIKMVMLF